MSKFTDYQFKPFLREAIQKLGFEEPTPIQKEMIPLIMKNTSAIGQAHTGTGKSHSFLIPLVEKLKPEQNELQTVITAPTRELAVQLHDELKKLIEGTEIKSAILIGGTDKKRSAERLKSTPHIIVGTPGRIQDLSETGALPIHTASQLVIDEADLAFDMGFIEDIDKFASRMPEKISMYVFSATIPEKLKPFLSKYMNSPVHVRMDDKKPLTENMRYSLVPVRSMDKNKKLLHVMDALQPYLAIIFMNTKQNADRLATYLAEHGHKPGKIHGDLTPRERTRVMKQVRDLEYQYIVATDLAARGIDIPGVSHVINFELPDDLEFFVHRVGRTARAGMQGHAITLYEPSDEDAINQIEKLGIPFIHEDVKNGEWIEVKERQARKKRVREVDEIDKKADSFIRKPDKVKPGYKKKMAEQKENFKRRQRRIKKKS